MIHILYVEDDAAIARSLKKVLELESYKVTWVEDLQGARRSLEESNFELLLLDWNLPDGSGLSLAEELLKKDFKTPIIFLTARIDEDSAVKALASGATDYIRKPFGQVELLARIKRSIGQVQKQTKMLRVGQLSIDLTGQSVSISGEEIKLHRREFQILVALAKRAGSIVSRENLIESLDAESESSDRSIDSHVSRLRKKLKLAKVTSITISSVYGNGYRLDA